MPQKLIRLTCESNDGIFNGKFDEDIHIKKDSEIAFQSLTLEQTPDVITINNTNDTIAFSSRLYTGGDQIGTIKHGTYSKDNRQELLNAIQDAMNGVCDMISRPAEMNSQWLCDVFDLTDDKIEIAVKPSPFFPLASLNPNDGLAVYNTGLTRDTPTQKGVANAEVPEIAASGMGRLTQSPAGLLNECYMYMGDEANIPGAFIKSTGSWRIRLAAMTQGTANRPAFTLGMVDADGLAKLKDATITLADLSYAIQVDEASADLAQGGYSYINAKGSAAVTATAPFVKIENAALVTAAQNDVLEIVIRNGTLQGYVHQDAGGRTELPATAEADYHTKDMYPVVFFHLANTTGPIVSNLINNIQCSLDCWDGYIGGGANPFDDFIKANPQLVPTNAPANPPSALPATLAKYNPPDPGISTINWKTNIVLETIGVANYLGYTNKVLATYDVAANPQRNGVGADLVIPADITVINTNQDGGAQPYTQRQGYSCISKTAQPFAVDAQSYLVDTQTFMLDSYDSYGLSVADRNSNSGGSRRNIISTIPAVIQEPITGSTNTRVVYEPNTLDYIAIKNKSDIITRQLKMRLLDARYGPVATVGLATMTVLIRDQLGYGER